MLVIPTRVFADCCARAAGGRCLLWDGRPPPPDAQATPLMSLQTPCRNISAPKFRGDLAGRAGDDVVFRSAGGLVRPLHRLAAGDADSAPPRFMTCGLPTRGPCSE